MSIDAHLDRREPSRVQILREHVLAVAQHCADTLAPVGLSRLGYLAGLLHDFGKARARFQDYLHETDEAKQRALRGQINHSAAGAQWLAERFGEPSNPLLAVTLLLLELAISGHHGGLSDSLTPTGEDKLSQRIFPAEPVGLDECARNFFSECADEETLDALLQEAMREVRALLVRAKETGAGRRGLYPFQLGMAARLLLGALVDADRYDAMRFNAGGTVPTEQTADETFWNILAARLEARLHSFPQDGALSGSRRAIADACLNAADRPGGIYRLYAPTGGGKTLASLRFALAHAQKTGKARVFYVIPYTTIIEQTADELRHTLGDEPFLVEHHSGVLWEDGEKDDLDPRELYTERWNAPIILTTMVQFLNTLFAGRTGCARRMPGLQNAVLIFDEIQAIPTKCIDLFSAACTFLSRQCGATMLLCTATQPALDRANQPLCYDADVITDPETLFHAFRRTRVIDLRGAGEMDAAQLADFCKARMEEHRSLLVVLNTRSTVKKLHEVLRQEDDPALHLVHLSTGMCAAHRKCVVSDIRKWLHDGERVLCVSTQLIEAGVDLSFSCVVRSLAGLENLAQAAGRCNRHGEDPRLHEVYLIQSADENLKFLPEIRQGQRFCSLTLADFEKQQIDPLAPAVIARYYAMRYQSQETKKLMQYPLSREKYKAVIARDTSLFELLSDNEPGQQEAAHADSRTAKRFLRQAFATAGGIFEPIDSNATPVIVPHEEGAALIAKLETDPKPEIAMRLLRQAQQYAVNLFSYERDALEKQGALRELPGGVFALDGRFYDRVSGVTMDGAPMKTEIL